MEQSTNPVDSIHPPPPLEPLAFIFTYMRQQSITSETGHSSFGECIKAGIGEDHPINYLSATLAFLIMVDFELHYFVERSDH